MNQETYRRIVSGEDRRFAAGMLRVLLRAAGLLYGVVVAVRNKLYDLGVLKSYSVDAGVICVGNLTAGGTGKTPLVIWLCRYLEQKGLKCAVLTRGYKTSAGQMTDEPALLAKACGDVPVIVNSDRVMGARKAIEKHHAQILILDDGFQHRRLRRDMDIVAIDATCPFGYGRILPAGLLRESIHSLKRAGAVVITRTNQVEPECIQAIETQIRKIASDLPIAKTVHQLNYALTVKNEKIALDELVGKPVFAFCGIGNPEAFFLSLKQSGLNLVGTRIFDDHHAYTEEDMKALFERAGRCGAGIVLCTQKDWVKSALLAPKTKDFVFAHLAMELDFVEGFDKISSRLDELIEKNKM
ncbi:MAG: tetraacyldisaccharide 4'-kinase [Phycisphaerae bacterium]|nr:tetraacyldisaccharide 4'-kinase [Phycisphaerae bacterium]